MQEDYTITLKACQLLSAQLKYFEELIIKRALERKTNLKILADDITLAVVSIMEDIRKGQE